MKYSLKKLIGMACISAIIFCLISCDSVLPVPSISNGSGVSTLSEKLISTPENVKATHGKKGIITISWTQTPNAQFYFIYKASSPHDAYVQIEEVSATASSIDIKVPSGTSGYFKVAAVDTYGNVSDLSLSVYGTSLATPIITSIEESLDTATVYWYMLNVNQDSYLSSVRYNVNCYNLDGTIKETKTISATTDTRCTFEGLSNATKYYYEVEAYVASAQDSIERSLKLDSETAVNLIPKIADFTVSEGDYTNKIELSIKLPEIGKILAEGGSGGTSASSYENRPLYFVIQRQEKIEGNNTDRFETICEYLNFNGTTTQLVAEDTDKSEYEVGTLWESYAEGNTIVYADDITKENCGKKYEYRVLSFVDAYCAGTKFKKDNKITVTHDSKKAKVETGWAAASPRFVVQRGESSYVYEDQPEGSTAEPVVKYKSSDSVVFKVEWNDLGKASNYVYLLYENHRKLKPDNGGTVDTEGTNSFVVYNNSSYFNSVEEINNFIRKYEYTEPVDEQDEANAVSRGYYKYTLCIVPKNITETYSNPNENVTVVNDAAFIKVSDLSNIAITNGSGQAKSVIDSVVNGYKDKTVINFEWEDTATYKLKRNVLMDGSNEIDTSIESVLIPLVQSGETVPDGGKAYSLNGTTASVEDTGLIPGKRYSYSLFASNADFEDNESMSFVVETLGIPNVVFDKSSADYNTITVNWNKVQQASKYKIKHNSKEWIVKSSDLEAVGEEKKYVDENGEYEVHCTNGFAYTFIIKSNAIQDFETDAKTISATKAGENLTVQVDAVSCVNEETEVDSTEKILNDVYVLGPAQLDLKASEATTNYMIKVDWQNIEGVTKYALRRQCPNINSPEEPRVDIFCLSLNSSGSFDVTSNGEKIDTERMSVVTEGTRVVLSDKHVEATDSTKGYQVSQEQIAWGHEYIYSVTPINNVEHDPFDSSFIVNYQNITDTTSNGTSKKGFTSGYGLNVVASKSDSPDSIHITWDVPNSKATLKPQVWARPVGTTEWKTLGIYSTGTNNINVTLGEGDATSIDRCAKVEFAVNYEQNKTVSFKNSYLTYLAEKGYLDSNKKLTGNEPDNVGYEFTLQRFEADQPIAGSETFTEKVNWTLWNESNDDRKNKPGDGITGDCYEIYVLNKNCSNKWYKIATVSKEGKVTPTASSISWADVTVSGDINFLNVTANSVTDTAGVHDGLLKVQRDYLHYYKIVAKRKNSSGDVIEATLGAFDATDGVDSIAKKSVYTCRKISSEEFAKCVTLIMADVVHRKAAKEGSITGVNGTYSSTFDYVFLSHYKFYAEFDNYQHSFKKVPSSSDSFNSSFIIKTTNNGEGYADHDNTFASKGRIIYAWGDSNNPVSVSVTHESGLSSYQGSVSLIAGKHEKKTNWILDITYNNGKGDIKKTLSGDANVKAFFPFALGKQLEDGNDETDSSFPTMSGKWWEVRD